MTSVLVPISSSLKKLVDQDLSASEYFENLTDDLLISDASEEQKTSFYIILSFSFTGG